MISQRPGKRSCFFFETLATLKLFLSSTASFADALISPDVSGQAKTLYLDLLCNFDSFSAGLLHMHRIQRLSNVLQSTHIIMDSLLGTEKCQQRIRILQNVRKYKDPRETVKL